MKSLRFWLPRDGKAIEIPISGEYVKTVMLPAAEHEAGHIIAAHHFKARVLGIAAGFLPEEETMFLQALYCWDEKASVETQCIVKAAGMAADMLFMRSINEKSASNDLKDIAGLTGIASFEPFLDNAKKILAGYSSEFACITKALHRTLKMAEDLTLGFLPDKHLGSLLTK
jgi:hypothetical protein